MARNTTYRQELIYDKNASYAEIEKNVTTLSVLVKDICSTKNLESIRECAQAIDNHVDNLYLILDGLAKIERDSNE